MRPRLEFHLIAFSTVDEAAAFVAALTRQLAAPRADLPRSPSLEVSISLRAPGADVFLSPDALAAASQAFGAIPPTRIVQTRPADSIVLVSGVAEALGLDDVLRRLPRSCS